MPIPIEMPKLSDTMTEGTLVKWKKKEGDAVEVGDVIAEVETDKATMEMEAFDEGTLAKILVKEGEKIPVGGRIGILLEEGEDASAVEAFLAEGGKSTVATSSAPSSSPSATDGATTSPTPVPSGETGRVRASPLARKVASQHGVDLTVLKGTGPGERIVARDVLQAASSGASVPRTSAPAVIPSKAVTVVAGEGDQIIELSGMRRTIAQRLLESKQQIPHFYLNITIDAAPLSKLRKEINAVAEATGTPKVTVNDFILLAAAQAAAAHPKVNASWAGTHIVQFASVNLAVAVAVDDGLITPVIPNADKLSLKEISALVKELAGKARNKKLKPEEYQGGTLTVTNLGAYGIEQFNAIINPPQSLILAVGTILKQPVVNDKNEIVPGMRMHITLSADHRVVDGAVGAEYMQTLKKLLENPSLMLF